MLPLVKTWLTEESYIIFIKELTGVTKQCIMKLLNRLREINVYFLFRV